MAARDAQEANGGEAAPPVQQGRPRDEEEGEAGPEAKRTKIEKLEGGMYHPVSISFPFSVEVEEEDAFEAKREERN